MFVVFLYEFYITYNIVFIDNKNTPVKQPQFFYKYSVIFPEIRPSMVGKSLHSVYTGSPAPSFLSEGQIHTYCQYSHIFGKFRCEFVKLTCLHIAYTGIERRHYTKEFNPSSVLVFSLRKQ